jgi:hypothetical protein
MMFPGRDERWWDGRLILGILVIGLVATLAIPGLLGNSVVAGLFGTIVTGLSASGESAVRGPSTSGPLRQAANGPQGDQKDTEAPE